MTFQAKSEPLDSSKLAQVISERMRVDRLRFEASPEYGAIHRRAIIARMGVERHGDTGGLDPSARPTANDFEWLSRRGE